MWRFLILMMIIPVATIAQVQNEVFIEPIHIELAVEIDESDTLSPIFKNIRLNQTTEVNFPPCEPSVVINTKKPENIVVSAAMNRIYHSTDSGRTWSEQRVTSPHGVWGNAMVVSDKKGDFYYIHLSDPTGKNWLSDELLDRIVVQRSTDGGVTWDEGNYTGHNPPKDNDKTWAVADKRGKLFVTWTQFDSFGSDKPQHKSNIMYSSSPNGGKKWSVPVAINQLSGNCLDDDKTVMGAMPAILDDGRKFITWAYDGQILLDRSYDKGKTWLDNDIVVAQQHGGWKLSVPGVQQCNATPVLISDRSETMLNGMLYLNWSDQRNGENDTDIWFTSSHNGGDTWSSRVRVNDDGPGKHQFMSWMTQDPTSGFIYIVYYDRRDYDDNNTDVFLAYSKDGGRTFRNKKISESPFIPDEDKFFGDYINIDALDGTIIPVWTRMDDGKTSIITTVIKQEDLDRMELHP